MLRVSMKGSSVMSASLPVAAPHSGSTPAGSKAPRRAASLILITPSPRDPSRSMVGPSAHDGDGDGSAFRVLMMQRVSTAKFMPNTYVFPGGAVDDEDVAATTRYRDTLLPKSSHSSVFFTGDGAVPWDTYLTERIAALRETREELGVGLRPSRLPSPQPPYMCEMFPWRSPDNEQQATSTSAANDGPTEDRRLFPEMLLPFSNWITPVVEKRRFDAFFFLACAAPGLECRTEELVRTQPSEVSAYKWVTPAEALSLHGDPAAQFTLPPPTFITMHHLSQFTTVASLFASLCARNVRWSHVLPAIEPQVAMGGGDAARDVIMMMPAGALHLSPGDHRLPVSLGARGAKEADLVVRIPPFEGQGESERVGSKL